MSQIITGLTAQSFHNMQLDAGAFIEDFDCSSVTSIAELMTLIENMINSPKCLGATRGGASFTTSPEFREPEVDGKRQSFVGSSFKDSVTVEISTSIVEYTPENLERIIAASDMTRTGTNLEIYTFRERLTIDPMKDYIPRLSWVGSLLHGGIAVITLFNAMNVNGVNMTSEDKSEGEFEVTFRAHACDFYDRNHAPYEIVLIKDPNAQIGGGCPT